MLRDDAGAAVAVVAPGLVALGGVLSAWPELLAVDSELAWLGAGTLAGVLLNSVRAVVVDPTFRLGSRPRPGAVLPERPRGVGLALPDYARLADPGRLAAFREARASEGRPAQLYGNLLLAVLVSLAAEYADPGAGYRWRLCLRPDCLLPIVGALAAMAVLYAAARAAHRRYMDALERIHSLP